MAPISKEAEALVASTTTPTPPAPNAKSPTETPTRPQPLALEIPVTVNGARTVDGSDKREPFSESSLTVLVFPQGAVARISTPLVPGQLIFLTNEKTKKEVVCQVVKSKPAGTSSGYVELRFTEPAPGFWGLLVPAAPATPVAPRPAAPVAPAAPKAILPAAPLASKPIAPKPVAPPATSTPPVKLAVAPPPIAKPEPQVPQSVAPANPAPPISVAPPAPVAALPEHSPVLPTAPVVATPLADVSPVSTPALPQPPAPSLHDYSKEINALFAVPHAPASTPASSTPSSEELKLQAARLQAQLSSMLFTETPAAPVASSAPSVTVKSEHPVTEVAKKVLEIAQDESKPVVNSEPKPTPPVRKPVPASLSAVEEVKIPAWLAPLSQNSEPSVAEAVASRDDSSESDSAVSVNSEESFDALVANESHRPHSAVFGGQLLGESSVAPDQVSSTGSKKDMFLGLAAAALLLIGGGAWYFRQNLAGVIPAASVKPASVPSSSASMPVTDLPASRAAASTPAANTAKPAPANSSPASSQPAKNSSPAPTQAVFAPAPEPRNSNPAPHNAAPPVEPPKKPVLGDVRLAAPVVNRGADSQQDSDALPSIETNSSPAGTDSLPVVHRKEPDAPLPIGGDVKPASLLKSVPPVYPQVAKTERISGTVQIDALVDASGNVAAAKILSGPPILHRAALDAVKQWKYTPAMLDGQPTSMHLTVTVQFRAQ